MRSFVRVLVGSSALLSLSFVCTPSFVQAAGYELLEQSGQGLGQAFAGVSTGIGDGSEVFTNPAAMTELSTEDTLSAHISFIAPQARFKDRGSAYIPQLGGGPLAGNDGDDGGVFAAVPNVYVAHQFSDSIAAGFGVNSPFGLSSEYDENWVGRYQAIKSQLKIVNFNPAIAVKPFEMLSLGASMQVMHAEAELTNAIDFGAIGLATLGLPTASALGLLPQSSDGFGKVAGDDWGTGYGLSALLTPTDDLRLGVSFRSKVDLTLRGDGEFDVPSNAAVLTSTGAFTDTRAAASVTLPESIAFGGAYDVSDRWTVFADAVWVRWSRFDELRVKFESVQPDSVQEENWDNTWRYSIGTRYAVDDEWAVRAGFTYDETPIPSAEFRTPRIPDNNRYWMAFGVDYSLSEKLTLSANYAHLFVPDTSTNVVGSSGSVLRGDWDLGVDIVGLALIGRF